MTYSFITWNISGNLLAFYKLKSDCKVGVQRGMNPRIYVGEVITIAISIFRENFKLAFSFPCRIHQRSTQ